MDLLEIDAASNTGVDDVRDVIENAQYRPARGNYKVYLVDEVHMLSKNAFNALLKTLEEPPEHAKFLLATTDPQKLPVTVLSRCLQFNLKRLTDSQIAQQVERILAAEGVPFEPESVREIARGGNGSLRDALVAARPGHRLRRRRAAGRRGARHAGHHRSQPRAGAARGGWWRATRRR